ncbi:MAG: hypothetical protein ACFE0Q_07680 [Anaerolineae bacterium]
MNHLDNDYNAMVLHKAREQELILQAENERRIKDLHKEVVRRVRRVVRLHRQGIR